MHYPHCEATNSYLGSTINVSGMQADIGPVSDMQADIGPISEMQAEPVGEMQVEPVGEMQAGCSL